MANPPSRQSPLSLPSSTEGDGTAGDPVSRADRLYALVEALRAAAPQERSARSLAEHFEVSMRTIQRDLSALQQAGVPIYAAPRRRGGYALDIQHTLPPRRYGRVILIRLPDGVDR